MQSSMQEKLAASLELERAFDQEASPDWFGALEIVNDFIVLRGTSATDHAVSAKVLEEVVFLSATTQAFFASYLMARRGLYSPAYGCLRQAIEHALRAADAMEEPGFVVGGGSKRRQSKMPDMLRRQGSANLWCYLGPTQMMSVLTGDVHLDVGCLDPETLKKEGLPARFLQFLVPNAANGCRTVMLVTFGSHESSEHMATPSGFVFVWSRCMSWLIDKIADHCPVLRERCDEAYPVPPEIDCPLNVKEAAKKMWSYHAHPKAIFVADVTTGKITSQRLDSVQFEEDRYGADAMPICKRDPLRNYLKTPLSADSHA